MLLRVTATPPLGEKRCKGAADKNLAVRLDDDDLNCAVRVRVETVERGLPARRGCYQDPQRHRQGEKLPHFFQRKHLSGANDYFMRGSSGGKRARCFAGDT